MFRGAFINSTVYVYTYQQPTSTTIPTTATTTPATVPTQDRVVIDLTRDDDQVVAASSAEARRGPRMRTSTAPQATRMNSRKSNSHNGYPSLVGHLRLEENFKNDPSNPRHWVVPPKAKHASVRKYLSSEGSGGLSAMDRLWISRHRLRLGKDKRELLDEGVELYNALMRAHGKEHRSARGAWSLLKKQYVGPSFQFVEEWVELCECRM